MVKSKKRANNYDMKEHVTIFFIRKYLDQILNTKCSISKKAIACEIKESLNRYFIRKSFNQILNSLSLDQGEAIACDISRVFCFALALTLSCHSSWIYIL